MGPAESAPQSGGRASCGSIINDWQLSGIFTGGPATATTWASATSTTARHKNLTGSPDYGARIVYMGDPGSGCSSNQYTQFNRSAVTGPTTTASAWSRAATS